MLSRKRNVVQLRRDKDSPVVSDASHARLADDRRHRAAPGRPGLT
jgi:hypothetical protein